MFNIFSLLGLVMHINFVTLNVYQRNLKQKYKEFDLNDALILLITFSKLDPIAHRSLPQHTFIFKIVTV